MKVIRVIVIEGNPSWVKRTLEASYLSPGEDIRFSWHQVIRETKREITGADMTDEEFYVTVNRTPGNSIEEHETEGFERETALLEKETPAS